MNVIAFIQFFSQNSIEMRWDDDVLSTWIPPYDLEEFAQLISSSLTEGGRDATIVSDGSVWIDLVPICEYYGIDPEAVFAKPK